jgi:uncharacterized protein YdeI (YjbR/CyaY-like superfamily)
MAAIPADPFFFPDAQAFRTWLAVNGSEAGSAWIALRKAGVQVTGITYAEALEEAICHGWIDGKTMAYNANFFLVRFSPRKPGGLWSLANKKRAEALIEKGLMTEAGMKQVEIARQNGRWQSAYSSREPEQMHPGLEHALQQNPQALANFMAFAPSYRIQYIGWVNAARRPETLRKRIAAVVERSLLNRRPGIDL